MSIIEAKIVPLLSKAERECFRQLVIQMAKIITQAEPRENIEVAADESSSATTNIEDNPPTQVSHR